MSAPDAEVVSALRAWREAVRETAVRVRAWDAIPDDKGNAMAKERALLDIAIAELARDRAYARYDGASAAFVAAGSPSNGTIVAGLYLLCGPATFPEPVTVYRVREVRERAATVEIIKAEDTMGMVGKVATWVLTNLEASVRLGDVRVAEHWEPAPPEPEPETKPAGKGKRAKKQEGRKWQRPEWCTTPTSRAARYW